MRLNFNKYHTDEISDKKFLITGGAGFIGSNLVEYLLQFGAKKVRVLDDFSNGLRKNIQTFLSNPAFELIEGDIRDYETCLKAMQGIDYVSHQAALGSVPRSIKAPIISNDVGRVNNSGPRLGYSYMVGTFEELAKRPEDQGGLDIFPGVSSIGYQFEGQYVGTENFSALVEGIFNVSGLEQGQFIPSFSLLNGFRFGQSGWEFAFGPSFTLKRTSKGFFDTQGLFGKGEKAYFSERDWSTYATDNFKHNDADSTYYINGTFTNPSPFDVANNADYNYGTHLDARGDFKLSANWLMAFGRTFKAGSLNIPVNIYYSSSKGGGNAGVSVGFNVAKSKKNINSSDKFSY